MGIYKLSDATQQVSKVPTATQTITAQSAAVKPLVVKGAASQSANLLEALNSSATSLFAVSSAGVLSGSSLSLGAWTSFTPTVTAGTGSFTSVSGAGSYCQIGKMVTGYVNITITTNGTAAGGVIFTLPVTMVFGNSPYIGQGRADNLSGKMLQVKSGSATTGVAFNYDNTYPGATGEILRILFTYEAA